MTRHLLTGLVAAVVLTAATGLGALSTPASAATCADASGVSLVVDFGALGGGTRTSCLPGGAGKDAGQVLTSGGYPLTYVQRFPGFVCRISGVPADDPCVNTPPADAYWGLFWSDGRSGEWVYASTSAGSLSVPAGGYVGMAWQTGPRRVPGARASVHPTPSPTRKPQPSKAPIPTPTPSAAPEPSASPTPSRTPQPSRTPKPSPTPSSAAPTTTAPTTTAPTTTAPSSAESPSPVASVTDDDSAAASAVPTWLVLAVLAVLLAGGAAAVVVRRRGST